MAITLGALIVFGIALDCITYVLKDKAEGYATTWASGLVQEPRTRSAAVWLTKTAIQYPTATVIAAFLILVLIIVIISAYQAVRFGAPPSLSKPEPIGAVDSALGRAFPNVVIEHADVVNFIQRGPNEYEATVRLHTVTLRATLHTTASIGAQVTVVKPPVQTRLKLQFSGGDTLPIAIDQDNIWRWYTLANVIKGYDPTTQMIKEAGRIWTVFLIFDEPTNFKQIRIDGSGASLPMHEVKDSSIRGAVIVFMGELSGIVVDIQLIV